MERCGRECGWERGTGQRGIKGREKWDNCNSIANKTYFLKKELIKERLLKAARGKERGTYKGVPIRLSAFFLKRDLAGKKGLERSI